MVIGERRSGIWQVVPELVRGTGQAGLTSPVEWVQQQRIRFKIKWLEKVLNGILIKILIKIKSLKRNVQIKRKSNQEGNDLGKGQRTVSCT